MPEPIIHFLRRDRTPFGGAENYLARLSHALTDAGIAHRILHSRQPRWLPSWLRALTYNLAVCLGKRGRFYFSLERVTCAEIYRAGDGVHRAFLETRPRSLNPLHPVYLWLERRCFANSRCIIANSLLVRRQIIDYYAVDPARIRVIYPGIDLAQPVPDGDALRRELGIPAASRVILFVGAGFARKGVAPLLQLLSRVRADYRALIVGKDKRLADYRRLAEELGLAGRVVFTGPRTDIDRFYAAADLLLFPTRYEPFSNVVLEAMRLDNAVITTRQNGAAEVLDEALLMADPEDAAILPQIERLLTDDAWLERVKQRNRDTAAEFSIERNAAETLAVIRAVMGSGRGLGE